MKMRYQTKKGQIIHTRINTYEPASVDIRGKHAARELSRAVKFIFMFLSLSWFFHDFDIFSTFYVKCFKISLDK